MTLFEKDHLKNLPNFLQEWSKSNGEQDDLGKQLSDFLVNWQSIVGNQDVDVAAAVTVIDSRQLQNFISDMTPFLAALRAERRNGNAANIWEVSGLKRDEVRISSVLAWFLDSYGEHGQESALLSGLLNSIKDMPENFPSSKVVSSSPYWVNVETCPSGDKCSRVDIEIEGDKFLLFIEVKIDAVETNNQLDRYLEIGEVKSGNRPWGIIFLTPSGCKPKVSTIAKKDSRIVCMSWRNISKVFYAHGQALPLCFSQSLLYQFAQYSSKF